MEFYKNLSGDSGVAAYEITNDSIKVGFKDGCVYLYTYQSAGSANIERMKSLAISGQGLNSFIIKSVKNRFASKRC